MAILIRRGVLVPTGADVSSNLIHEWPLDTTHAAAGAGAVLDTVVAGTLPGTATGGITFGVSNSTMPVTPQYASAMGFDGVSGTKVLLDSNANMFNWNSGSFSIAFWCYINDNTALSAGGVNDQYYMQDDVAGDGTNYFNIHNRTGANAGGLVISVSGISGGTALGVNAGTVVSATWTHLVYTSSGGGFAGNTTANARVYANGSPATIFTGGAGDNSFHSATTCCFGAGVPTMGMLAGRLYRIRVYSRVLSLADVQALYSLG